MSFCCKSCGRSSTTEIVDLGSLPISNALVSSTGAKEEDQLFPLRIVMCDNCTLVQLAEQLPATSHFHSEYVYFSSHSETWLSHCSQFADEIIKKLGLNSNDLVVEVASNDGYLLNFFQQRGLSVLGIEPSSSVAKVSIERGIDTQIDFFGGEVGKELLQRNLRPRLIVANNVLAHVPNLMDFVEGFHWLLRDDAMLTCEVHYFRDLFENSQFDAFYHEHYYYYTIHAACSVFEKVGLRVFDVERIPTHGGSLRLYVCREEAAHRKSESLGRHLSEEREFLDGLSEQILSFQQRISDIAVNTQLYLKEQKALGRKVVGYGAPAKATTLLNIAKIDESLLPFTVDRNPHKQGQLLPGIRVPIRPPEALMQGEFDVIAILAWNLRDEIVQYCRSRLGWDGEFVVFVPELTRIQAE